VTSVTDVTREESLNCIAERIEAALAASVAKNLARARTCSAVRGSFLVSLECKSVFIRKSFQSLLYLRK